MAQFATKEATLRVKEQQLNQRAAEVTRAEQVATDKLRVAGTRERQLADRQRGIEAKEAEFSQWEEVLEDDHTELGTLRGQLLGMCDGLKEIFRKIPALVIELEKEGLLETAFSLELVEELPITPLVPEEAEGGG